jgi:EF hand
MLSPLLFCLGVLLLTPAHADGVETIIGHAREPGPVRKAGKRARAVGAEVSPGGRFRQLDSNRDGRISRQEMEQGNRARMQAFDRADANVDGQLSKDEWRAYQGNKKRGGKKKRQAAGF